jgi:hypothetical protein
MAKSKLVAAKRVRMLLVRTRRDRLWMSPGVAGVGGKRKKIVCAGKFGMSFQKLKLGRVKLWKEVKKIPCYLSKTSCSSRYFRC